MKKLLSLSSLLLSSKVQADNLLPWQGQTIELLNQQAYLSGTTSWEKIADSPDPTLHLSLRIESVPSFEPRDFTVAPYPQAMKLLIVLDSTYIGQPAESFYL